MSAVRQENIKGLQTEKEETAPVADDMTVGVRLLYHVGRGILKSAFAFATSVPEMPKQKPKKYKESSLQMFEVLPKDNFHMLCILLIQIYLNLLCTINADV